MANKTITIKPKDVKHDRNKHDNGQRKPVPKTAFDGLYRESKDAFNSEGILDKGRR